MLFPAVDNVIPGNPYTPLRVAPRRHAFHLPVTARYNLHHILNLFKMRCIWYILISHHPPHISAILSYHRPIVVHLLRNAYNPAAFPMQLAIKFHMFTMRRLRFVVNEANPGNPDI